MSLLRGVTPGSFGLIVRNHDVLIIVRGGDKAAGDILELDIANADAVVLSNATSGDDSGFSNMLAPTAARVKGGGIHAVCLEDILDDTVGLVRVQGIIDSAFCIKAAGDISAGDPLVVTTSKNLDGTPAAGERYDAMALAALSSPSTRTLSKVLFDGIYGFGTFVS